VLSSVKIDNFVMPLSLPVEPESDSQSVDSAAAAAAAASAAASAVALDEDDGGPDESSSAIYTATLAPASSFEDDAELEQKRVQLLQQVRDRASATEESLQAERDRQHSVMLHALEQRKIARSEAATSSQESVAEGDAADKCCVINDASQAHADAVTGERVASSASDTAAEHDRSNSVPATLPLQNLSADSCLCHSSSRSSSPVSSRLRPLRPDIRIDIPSQHSQGESEAESMRGGLSDLWTLRLQSVNAGLHAQLVEMGFDSKIAVVALEQTGSASLQESIDFCLDHNNEDWAGADRIDGGDSDNSSGDISVGHLSPALVACGSD